MDSGTDTSVYSSKATCNRLIGKADYTHAHTPLHTHTEASTHIQKLA